MFWSVGVKTMATKWITVRGHGKSDAPNKKIKNPNYREPNTEIFFDELNDRRETMHILYVADNRNRHVATIKGSDPEKIDAEFKKRFGSENFERAWHPRTYGLDGDFLMGVDVQVIEAE